MRIRSLASLLLLLAICGSMYTQQPVSQPSPTPTPTPSSKAKSSTSAKSATTATKPYSQPLRATPRWLRAELSAAQISAAGQCRYTDGYDAIDVGRGRGTDEAHCFLNCSHGPLKIAPSPVIGNINQDLAINFWIDDVLGGPNQVCASNGTVDWGDGTSSPMPSAPWTDCDRRPSGMLHDTVGKPPNYTLHHTYVTAGEYCVSARIWGNHKYHGAGSCSYDCTVTGSAQVVIHDVKP